MKHSIAIIIYALLSIPGCIGKPGCNDSCTLDEGCSSGLSCLSTASGYTCLPGECAGCTASKPNCSFVETYSNTEGSSCTFRQCQ